MIRRGKGLEFTEIHMSTYDLSLAVSLGHFKAFWFSFHGYAAVTCQKLKPPTLVLLSTAVSIIHCYLANHPPNGLL